MPSAWVAHVKAYYAAQKKKNKDYRYSSAMKDARATYKSGKSKAGKDDDEKAPDKPKRRRKRKAAPSKKAKPSRDIAETAAAPKKKKKPKRKRPAVPKDFTNLN